MEMEINMDGTAMFVNAKQTLMNLNF